jgi:hypothetical protein
MCSVLKCWDFTIVNRLAAYIAAWRDYIISKRSSTLPVVYIVFSSILINRIGSIRIEGYGSNAVV